MKGVQTMIGMRYTQGTCEILPMRPLDLKKQFNQIYVKDKEKTEHCKQLLTVGARAFDKHIERSSEVCLNFLFF